MGGGGQERWWGGGRELLRAGNGEGRQGAQAAGAGGAKALMQDDRGPHSERPGHPQWPEPGKLGLGTHLEGQVGERKVWGV